MDGSHTMVTTADIGTGMVTTVDVDDDWEAMVELY
jgi:hypothetical protein